MEDKARAGVLESAATRLRLRYGGGWSFFRYTGRFGPRRRGASEEGAVAVAATPSARPGVDPLGRGDDHPSRSSSSTWPTSRLPR